MTVTIIVPAFNEAGTIDKIIKQIQSTNLTHQKEIIVVDDGSRDRTAIILKKINGIKIISNSKNKGKGYSIRRAIKKATGEIIIIQDADLEYSPTDLPKLLKPFNNPETMVVYGSRIKGNNPNSHWTFYLGGKLMTYITNFFYRTKLTDQPTGYKLFRTKLLKNFNLKSDRFEFCSEITAKIAKNHVEISEIPISYKPRPVKEKKLKWYDGLKAIYTLIKYRIVNS